MKIHVEEGVNAELRSLHCVIARESSAPQVIIEEHVAADLQQWK